MNSIDLRKQMNQDFGKVFTCTFTKKDGTTRKLLGQLGVNASDTPSTTAKLENYITVYDVENRGFRNVNLDTVVEYRCIG